MVCNGRRGTIPKKVNPHSVIDDVRGRVVVSVPQEAEKITVVLLDEKAVEHVLDVGSDRHLILPKPHKNT